MSTGPGAAGPRSAGPRVAVVGGGLSGLVAAYQLSRDLPTAQISVLEASDRVGGALDTVDFPSGPMELGAEAFVRRRPEAMDLVADLELTHTLHPPGGRAASILTGGRLHPVPRHTLMGLPSDADALAGVLSAEEVAVAAAEQHRPLDWTPGSDVSLGGLVAERFGPAVVTRLVDPMLGGVYAAPSAGLGLREVVPGLATALDRGAASLTEAIRGLVGVGPTGPVFATPDGGYRRLVDALVAALRSAPDVRIETGVACTGIRPADGDPATRRTHGGYAVDVVGARGHGTREVDLVVVAVPVPHATGLVTGAAGPDSAARDLAGVRAASSAVVALEVDRGLDLPDHSGVLVATDEPVPFKAVTLSSRKWPHLDDRPGHLVRVSFGRLDDDEVLSGTDESLVAHAVSGLARLGGSDPRVLHSRVRRWDHALAEIGPGHTELIARVRADLARRTPGLELVGGVTEGVGVPACIGSARAAARRLAGWWQD